MRLMDTEFSRRIVSGRWFILTVVLDKSGGFFYWNIRIDRAMLTERRCDFLLLD